MEQLVAGASRLGIRLSGVQVDSFRRYYRELVEWNARVNLTSVTDRHAVQTRHFLDSLTVCLVADRRRLDGAALDIGSGGGLPGIPLKITFPGLTLTLLEATAKKTAFLEHLIEVLGMGDVEIRTGRAEALAHEPEMREHFDLVLARGVAKLPVLAELSLPFCRPGGVVVAHKGGGIADELSAAQRAIETMGGHLAESRAVDVPALGAPRTLVVLEKVSETPKAYPRRPGMPRKRPL